MHARLQFKRCWRGSLSGALILLAGMMLAQPWLQAQTGESGVAAMQAPGEASVDGSVKARLIGSWRLVSRQSMRADGQIEPDKGLSQAPMGVLIYDASGHVAAQLSRRDRTVAMIGEECAAAAAIKGTPDTAQTVLGYDAYFGTYTVNEQAGIVTHHLEAAIFPGDIGKSIDRAFTLAGDRLTIKFNTTTGDGVKVTRVLTWERMK